MRVNGESQTLTIERISDSNAGAYKCVVDTHDGPLTAIISVSVIDPPAVIVPGINPALPLNLNITYGDRLYLDCRSPSAVSEDIQFSWTHLDQTPVSTSHILDVGPDDVTPGVYRCHAFPPMMQHTVIVTLVGTPPICEDPGSIAIPITATEKDDLYLRKRFRYRLDRSDISIQWKRLNNGELTDVEFGSRFHLSTSEAILRFRIDNAALTDRGLYHVNVSNSYGHTLLMVNINVDELMRTKVLVQLPGTPCGVVRVSKVN
jgi:hypothetical protein